MKTPSTEAQHALASLRKTVHDTLERKRKLGQYAVIWRQNRIEYLGDVPLEKMRSDSER